ncbi:hypothetical protein LUZ60_007773 [Juncus effusus]|nr:hypothetical protein LUZ60_007773 [Juncus effusus]
MYHPLISPSKQPFRERGEKTREEERRRLDFKFYEEEMERRGGCCIARYGGGAEDAWRVGRIMLKYRPIAPKPAAMAQAAPATAEQPKSVTTSGRNKRKATGSGTGTGRRGRKPKKQLKVSTGTAGTTEEREEKCSSSSSSSGTTSVDSSSLVTLPLMPESPEEKKVTSPVLGHEAPSPVLVPRPVRPVGSCVTLEGLSNIWREGEVPLMPDMVADEAPEFVSDGWGRVTWTNDAYRAMVTGGDGEEEEVRVGLVTRGLVPVWGTCYGYTCRVRVRYACKKKGKVSLAAPCDVWRVEGGGYAWRLDIKAALSLTLSLS